MSEDERTSVTVPLYKVKGERNECKNHRGMVGKGYAKTLKDKVRSVTEELNNEEGGL